MTHLNKDHKNLDNQSNIAEMDSLIQKLKSHLESLSVFQTKDNYKILSFKHINCIFGTNEMAHITKFPELD